MKISATLLVIFAAGTNANASPDPVDDTPRDTPIALRSEQEDAGAATGLGVSSTGSIGQTAAAAQYAGAATGLGWTPREGFYGDGYGHPSSDGALSEDLVHGRELQQAQCCSAGGIACFFAGCSVCAPCQHCLGPQALLPWCMYKSGTWMADSRRGALSKRIGSCTELDWVLGCFGGVSASIQLLTFA